MRSDARKRHTLADLGRAAGHRHDSPRPLVGLIGKKRSGKDSLAATLVEECGFRRFAFADPLKEAALKLDPVVVIGFHSRTTLRLSEVVEAEGWEFAKEIPEVRRLLQVFGTDAIRSIQDDFWVRATLPRAVDHARESGPVVITDVRFPNEADELREAGGTIVRIVRPGLESRDAHESETALDDYLEDVRIYNGGTLEDLAEQARALPGHRLLAGR